MKIPLVVLVVFLIGCSESREISPSDSGTDAEAQRVCLVDESCADGESCHFSIGFPVGTCRPNDAGSPTFFFRDGGREADAAQDASHDSGLDSSVGLDSSAPDSGSLASTFDLCVEWLESRATCGGVPPDHIRLCEDSDASARGCEPQYYRLRICLVERADSCTWVWGEAPCASEVVDYEACA